MKPLVPKYLLGTFFDSTGWMQFFQSIQELLPEIDWFSIQWDGCINGVSTLPGPHLVHGATVARRFCRHQPTSSYYQMYRVAAKYNNSPEIASGDRRTLSWSVGSHTITVTSEAPYYRNIDNTHWYVPFNSNVYLGATVNFSGGSAHIVGINNNIASFDTPVTSIPTSIVVYNSPGLITTTLATTPVTAKFKSQDALDEVALHNSARSPLTLQKV